MQPIYKKQYESMKGMAVIAPEMKQIQAKYKDNKDQQAQMEMMKEIKAIAAAARRQSDDGLRLAALQMPIFFFVVYPMIQHYDPKMELVAPRFCGFTRWRVPTFAADFLRISMFFSFQLSSTPPADDMQRQQQMLMAFAMPFMLLLFLNPIPSAFTMYWTDLQHGFDGSSMAHDQSRRPQQRNFRHAFWRDLKVENPNGRRGARATRQSVGKPCQKITLKIETTFTRKTPTDTATAVPMAA